MKIEVITQNEQDTLQAQELGADRVELVSAIKEGGLTPSFGVLKNVLSSATIPVHIMIRPHSYGFVYDDTDCNTMKEDISIIKELGGTRIVFGCITPEGEIDEKLLEKVIEHAPDMEITFHRAFDEVRSQETAYRVLNKYRNNISRILTSGGKPTCAEATKELADLVALARELDGPAILPGSGLSPDNLAMIHEEVGAEEYHIGSGVRVDGDFSKQIDPIKLDKIKHALQV